MDTRLTTLLSSSEKDKQLLGIQLCAKMREPDSIPLLARLLTSNDTDISALALGTAITIGQHILLERPRTLSRDAFHITATLLKKHKPDFVRQLLARLDDFDNSVVIQAMMTTRHFLSPERAGELLKRFGKTPDSRVRATLVRHIGPVAGSRSPEILAKFLDDSDSRVRANGVEAFESLNNKIHLRIIQRLRNDSDARVRANTAKALCLYGDPQFLPLLTAMLPPSEKAATRISGVWAIGEIGRTARDILPSLRAVSEEKDPEIRRHLKLLLDKVGVIPEVDFLRSSLKEELRDKIKAEIIQKSELRIEQVRKGEYLLCGIFGSLTVDALLPIKFAFQEMEAQQDIRVILNCSRLEFVDSSGAALLANVSRRFAQKGGYFRLFGCNDRLTELFHVTGLDYVISLYPDEDAATIG